MMISKRYASLSPLEPLESQEPLPPLPTRPSSPAYFTGHPMYHDMLSSLDALLARPLPEAVLQAQLKRRVISVEDQVDTPVDKSVLEMPERGEWHGLIPRLRMKNVLGFPPTAYEYRVISAKVQAVFESKQYRWDAEVRQILQPFLRSKPKKVKVGKDMGMEEGGVVAATGWRKSARAKAWIVPAREEGQGEVQVNGIPLGSWLREEAQRESVIRGLIVGNRVGRYNAWCTVTGGGMTGQVEAVRLALSRALAMQEYDLKPSLRKGKHWR